MHFQPVFGDLIGIYFFSNSHPWTPHTWFCFTSQWKLKSRICPTLRETDLGTWKHSSVITCFMKGPQFLIYKYGRRTGDLQCHSLLSTLRILFFTINNGWPLPFQLHIIFIFSFTFLRWYNPVHRLLEL